MYGLFLILNLVALGALFSNHRLAAMVCFLGYSAINLFFLFQSTPTDLDPIFFVVMTMSTLAVYAALTAYSRDQVLTHQKKRASFHLLTWTLVLAFFFGHWLLSLEAGGQEASTVKSVESVLVNGEVFMLLAIVVLWFVGKNLYDKR